MSVLVCVQLKAEMAILTVHNGTMREAQRGSLGLMTEEIGRATSSAFDRHMDSVGTVVLRRFQSRTTNETHPSLA